jgi:hypothetical protein
VICVTCLGESDLKDADVVVDGYSFCLKHAQDHIKRREREMNEMRRMA